MKRFVMLLLLLFVVVLLVTSRASAAEPASPVERIMIYSGGYGNAGGFFAQAEGQQSIMIGPDCPLYADGKKVSQPELIEWFRKAWGVRVVTTLDYQRYGTVTEARFVSAKQPKSVAAATANAADPSASCGKVSVPEGRSVASGSGTVVACEGGRSLVLTNRHVCPRLGGGKYFECAGKRYPAWCCCVDNRADLALLIVDAELPACTLAAAVPDTGTPTVQFGHPYAGPQRPKRGIIRGFVGWLRDGLPILHSGINTEQGDSGSGVFANGQLVGVTWGEGGSCVHLADVYQLLDTFCVNSKSFPALAKATHGVKIAAPAAPKQMQPAPCPNGTCPGGNGCPNGQCPMPPRGVIRRS